MALRVCAEPGCAELVERGRCAAHRSEREQYRGTRQSRGYDRAYDLHRAGQARIVASGKGRCWSCGKRIGPLEAWDNGHCDDDRSIIHGAQHVACNRDTSDPAPCVHESHRGISPGA